MRATALPVRAATTAANEPVDGVGGFGEGEGERSRGSDSGILREPADAGGHIGLVQGVEVEMQD